MSELDKTFLTDHWAAEIRRIESRVSIGQLDLHAIFGDVDDDLYLYLIRRTFATAAKVHDALPDWPPEDVRKNSTGDLPILQSIVEAAFFWRTIKRHLGRPTLAGLRIADYGAGWGRITRLVGKDVNSKDLFAFEPNPLFADLYEKCRCPGNLVRTDWGSAKSLKEYGFFDVIYCFSILTHTSDELAHRVADRWREMTRPGALIFATVRPRYFIGGETGDAKFLPISEKAKLLEDYDNGKLVYRAYPTGSGHWGVTVMSIDYVKRVFKDFEIDALYPNPQTQNQMMIVLRRK